MIKKTILLVTAVMLVATSATYAAKKIRVTNESGVTYYYKVGDTIKKIPAGSTKAFPLPVGKKKVKIQAGTSKSGNSVKGNKIHFEPIPISEAKANPFVQTNPVSGQTTDVSN